MQQNLFCFSIKGKLDREIIKINIIMNKLSKFVLGLTMALALVLGASAQAATMTPPQPQTFGNSGAQVVALQTILLDLGYSIPAGPTGYFGSQTKAALMAYQAAHGVPSTGFYGPLTYAALTATLASGSTTVGTYPAGCTSASGFSSTTGGSCSPAVGTFPAGCTSAVGYSSTTGGSCAQVAGTFPAGCSSNIGYSPTTGGSCAATTTTTPTGSTTLTGGAGNIQSVTLLGSYNNVQVEEAAVAKKVLGAEILADNGSDIRLSSVKVTIGAQTSGLASKNMSRYMGKVAVWLGSTKIGEANTADFTETSNVYSRSIALDPSAVIMKGQKGQIYISVDANTSVDSVDRTNAIWPVTLTSTRYSDATGAILTDSTAGITRNFTFGTITNVLAVKYRVTNPTIVVSNVQQVSSAQAQTNGVTLLQFDVKAEGAAMTLRSLPILLTTTNATNVTTVVNNIKLSVSGITSAFSESIPGTAATSNVVFGGTTSLNIAFAADETKHFTVAVDLNGEQSHYADGATVKADYGTTQVDASDVLDSQGNQLATGSTTRPGGALGNAQDLRANGIQVSLVSTSFTKSSATTTGASDLYAGTIIFNVKAFGNTAYIPKASPSVATASDAVIVAVTGSGSGPSLSSASIQFTGTESEPVGTNGWPVQTGDTSGKQFTITGFIETTSTSSVGTQLMATNFKWGSADTSATTVAASNYTFNLSGYKTSLQAIHKLP